MRFATPLVSARLTRRYKRFLADMVLDSDGREITAHCANPGSMLGLAEPGTRCWIEPNDDPKRKLNFGWRLVEHESGDFTGVDTGLANRIVKEALQARRIDGLPAHDGLRAEVRYGAGSRVDFLLTGERGETYLEVKSVTLSRRPGLAEFPDSVTARGTRHLGELARMVQAGHRAVLLFLVQRTDAREVGLAADIDPAYAEAFGRTTSAGVEVVCLGTRITPDGIAASRTLPFRPSLPMQGIETGPTQGKTPGPLALGGLVKYTRAQTDGVAI